VIDRPCRFNPSGRADSWYRPISMRGVRITFAILFYVSLDLSSPFVPGAFTFDTDTSVEGVSRLREGGEQALAVVSIQPSPRCDPASERQPRLTVRPARPRRVVDGWLVAPRRPQTPAPDAGTVSEDH